MKKHIEARVNPWLILAIGASMALGIFTYAASLPLKSRITGDAIVYLGIADSFTSIGDAFSYTGNRTYGLPLFLYVVRSVAGISSLDQWLARVSYALFILHLAASASFYRFFLRDLFVKSGLPTFTAAAAAAIIMAFPALVTHTTTPLTDTFCVDLLMLAAALHYSGRISDSLLGLAQSALCGLILGYAVMVRPSFWPAVLVFFGASFLEALLANGRRRLLLMITLCMAAGTLAVIIPALARGFTVYKTPSLQNPGFVKACSGASMQSGLSSVRVFWSDSNISKDPLPGVKDPFLLAMYGDDKEVHSIGSLLKCLCKKPFAIPIYLGKKTIGLFDEPYLQPYSVDLTPDWFTALQRAFELPAFCGFLALIILAFSMQFQKNAPESISLPWVALLATLMCTHLVMHIEGRYGFPAVPFSIAALFLGFAGARKAGRQAFIAWVIALTMAASLFLYQVHAWDLVVPVHFINT